MKTKTRDSVIVASIKGGISLHVRVVRSKKTYTRKQKHTKDIKRLTWQVYIMQIVSRLLHKIYIQPISRSICIGI